MYRFLGIAVTVLWLFCTASIFSAAAAPRWQHTRVSATAYNALPAQTKSYQPSTAAWGDLLKPGMHAIAVSRDLIERGLTRGTRVRIQGLPGVYVVLDKMSRRWHKKIDIYMGENIRAALAWGLRRHIRISWRSSR